jgi:hypothetical protein
MAGPTGLFMASALPDPGGFADHSMEWFKYSTLQLQ